MGIYALIILFRLVCVAAGSGLLVGAASLVAFLGSWAIFFVAVNLFRVSFLHCKWEKLWPWLSAGKGSKKYKEMPTK